MTAHYTTERGDPELNGSAKYRIRSSVCGMARCRLPAELQMKWVNMRISLRRVPVARALASIAAAAVGLFLVGAAGQDSGERLSAAQAPAGAIWVDSLDLGKVSQEWGRPRAGRSVDNGPLRLGGRTYAHGIGSHAHSEMLIDLANAATRFESMVGVDDEKTGQGSVTFEVWVDGKRVAATPAMRGGQPPRLLTANLVAARRLSLIITDADDGIDSDHGDWAGAVLYLSPAAGVAPRTISVPATPDAPAPAIHFGDPPVPAIHGPRLTGSTPGHPFLFRVPATGQPPLTFSARGLPPGLTLDPRTGIIAGSLRQAGTTITQITVKGPRGTARRNLTIVGGLHKLALTPPLGWNSWNVWAGAVDDAKVRAAADWMVKSGLAAHGFTYVNIDDTWEGPRDANGEITTNRKFPDMTALADYVHEKGLKLGIYSSPGPRTCAGFPGSWQHEVQDAHTWAKWGIDYLKHDWCSYGDVATGEGLERDQRPYRIMREALDKADRDIVYSLCQYGMGNVWEWGAKLGANCWRTTGDIGESWGSLQSIAFSQDGHEVGASPGHWNDPDMLVVGRLGWGPSIHPTRLKPNEQILHITMWCLQSAPLLLGCDLSQMDRFTLALMTNDEVLDVDQDPLGRPASRIAREGQTEVWARPLYDGTKAAGLFNRDSEPAKVTVNWKELGIPASGRGRLTLPVRDLWQQKNLGSFAESYSAMVPPHGAVLVKVGRPAIENP